MFLPLLYYKPDPKSFDMLFNKVISTVVIVLIMSLIYSCGATSDETLEATIISSEVTDGTSDDFKGVFNAYIKVKDHLVNSDLDNAKTGLEELHTTIEQVDASTLSEEDQMRWGFKVEALGKSIVAMQDAENIDDMRIEFEALSKLMYVTLTELGVKDLVIYKQYCPMAFDNQGAYWLSDKQEIMNPYFGDMMLHCGKVKEVLEFQ